MNIAGRRIAPDEPVYVIAEIGVNHDGRVERALMLTDAAADAGADAIKLQYFRADLLMSGASKLAAYQRAAGEIDPIEMLRRLELSLDGMARVVDRAHKLAMHAIVTVFSTELVAPAMELPWDALKSASPDIIHRPLLESLMATGKALIVSTGASSPAEIERAMAWLAPARERLALLHCISSYPTPDDQAHMRMAGHLSALFPGTPIGYSDHTLGVEPASLARSLGLCILEKHLTDSTSAPGPDHAASLTPERFAAYVHHARQESRDDADSPLLGEPFKRVIEIERDVRALSRQSIVARRAMPAGHTLEPGDLSVKRPGTGIEPFHLDALPGKRLAEDVEADAPITWDAVAGQADRL